MNTSTRGWRYALIALMTLAAVLAAMLLRPYAENTRKVDSSSGDMLTPQAIPSSVVNEEEGMVQVKGAGNQPDPGLVLRDGRLSVELDEVPFQEAMAELSQLTGIEIIVPALYHDVLLTRLFENVPIDKALHSLLHGLNHIYFYADGDESRQLTRILILEESTEEDPLNVIPVPVSDLLGGNTDPQVLKDMQRNLEEKTSRAVALESSESMYWSGGPNSQVIDDLRRQIAERQIAEKIGISLTSGTDESLIESTTAAGSGLTTTDQIHERIQKLEQQLTEQVKLAVPSENQDLQSEFLENSISISDQPDRDANE